jgi:hypothetical protein
MSRTRFFVSFALLLLVYGAPDLASACGSLASPSEVDFDATVDAQRAFVRIGPDRMATHLQISARNAGEEFAWVLPVPEGADLAVGNPDLFDELRGETRPELTVEVSFSNDSEGCGFGSTGSAGASEAEPKSVGAVEHVEGGRIGDYTYDIIDSSEADAATRWLEDHGYAVGETLDSQLGRYLNRGMNIAAIQLAGQAREVQAPDPLVVRTSAPEDGEIRYPLALSRASAPETTSLVMYVMASGRYRLGLDAETNYQDILRTLAAQELRVGLEPDYTAAVDAQVDQGPVWLTEYAHPFQEVTCIRHGDGCPPAITEQLDGDWADGGPYLTRLFARIPRADLRDLTVRPDDRDENVRPTRGADFESDEVEDELPDRPDAGGTVDASVMLLVILLLVGRRRR